MKTKAFRKVAEPFGAERAQSLVDYHVANGGISRNRKFEWLAQQVGVHDGRSVSTAKGSEVVYAYHYTA